MITDSRPIWDASLAEILSQPATPGTRASATDIPGVALEWMITPAYPNGAWFGSVGFHANQASLDAVPTLYLATASTAMVAGISKTYQGPGVGWVAQSRLANPNMLTAVVIGDSHHALLGPTIDTGYRTSQRASYLWWMLNSLDWALYVSANLAVGGTTVQQISDTVDSALNLSPDMIFDSSLTNDLLKSHRWSEVRDAKKAYYDKIISTGSWLIIFVAPNPSTIPDIIQDVIDHRKWCYDYASNNDRVCVVDGLMLTVDPSSATLSQINGSLPDGVHLSIQAAKIVGDSAAAIISKAIAPKQSYLPPFSTFDTLGKSPNTPQLYNNPGLLGSVAQNSANVSGVGPNNFSTSRIYGSAGVAVCSVESNGGWGVFSVNFSGCGKYTAFQRQITPDAQLLAALVGKDVIFEYTQEYALVSGVAEDYISIYTAPTTRDSLVSVDTSIIATSQIIPQGDGVYKYVTGVIHIPQETTILRINWITKWLSDGGGTIKLSKVRMMDVSKMAMTPLP